MMNHILNTEIRKDLHKEFMIAIFGVFSAPDTGGANLNTFCRLFQSSVRSFSIWLSRGTATIPVRARALMRNS